MLSNSVSPNIEKKLDEYLHKVLEVNKSINLTRVTDFNEARLLHLEDSLSVFEDLSKSPDGLYGDIGSGAGFPGVPLGLASKRETILVDSVKKKMRVVQGILDELSLDNIRTDSSRIEELGRSHQHLFSAITARALSSLPTLLELASPLLKSMGHLIALKAHVSDQEIEYATLLESKTGLRLIRSREFYLSDNTTFRSVYIFEKFKDASIKLPRKNGLAQKRPLKP